MSMVLSTEKALEIINALRKRLTPDEFSAVKYFAAVREPKEFYEIFTTRWPTLLDSPELAKFGGYNETIMPFKPTTKFGPAECRRITSCYAIQQAVGLTCLRLLPNEVVRHRAIPSVLDTLANAKELIQDDLTVLLDGQSSALVTAACHIVVSRLNDVISGYREKLKHNLSERS